MRIYQLIGMVCLGLLVSSCSSPKPIMLPPAPYKICNENQDPKLDGCVKEKPTSSITIRGRQD